MEPQRPILADSFLRYGRLRFTASRPDPEELERRRDAKLDALRRAKTEFEQAEQLVRDARSRAQWASTEWYG